MESKEQVITMVASNNETQVKVEETKEIINITERAMNKLQFKASLYNKEELALIWEAANGAHARPEEGYKVVVLGKEVNFDWKVWLSALYRQMESKGVEITGEFKPLAQFNIIQPREKQEIKQQATKQKVTHCPQHGYPQPCYKCALLPEQKDASLEATE